MKKDLKRTIQEAEMDYDDKLIILSDEELRKHYKKRDQE